MKNLIIILFFVTFATGQTRTFESYGGVGDGVTDNLAAWNAMKADYQNVDIVTFDGIYQFSNVVDLNNVNGLEIRGVGSTIPTIRTNQNTWMDSKDGDFNNITFRNIKFESTATSTGQGNSNALVAIASNSGSNILFEECEFTAPNAVTNGIKFFMADSSLYTNIVVRRCHFHDLGRMGLETVNHVYTALNTRRIDGILVEDSRFINTGLVQYGMGVSFSGRNDNVIVRHNTFQNNPTCAIELIGVEGCEIYGNLSTGTGGGNGINAVRLNVTTSTRPNNDVDVYDNYFESAITVIGTTNLRSRNNFYQKLNSNLFSQNFQNISFENDSFEVYGFNPNFNGGTPTAFMQVFTAQNSLTGDVSPNTNIDFLNCRMELTNNVGFFQVQQGTINIEKSDVYFTSSASQYQNVNSSVDVSIYVNGVLDSEIGNTGNPHGIIGYTNLDNYGVRAQVTPPVDPPTLSLNAIKRNLYYNIFNN